jgi:cytochrome c
MRIRTMAVIAIAILASTTHAFAADSAKDGAIAMVKKAVALIKADGPEKAYAEISQGGPFVDGGTYAVVQGFDAVTLAHATNSKLVGKNMIEAQDVDGKYFARDLSEHGKKEASFWYDFKFVNPATKTIQVKDQYCESLNQTVVCAGVYRP